MKIVVDVEETEGRCAVEISVQHSRIAGTFSAAVALEKLGESVGPVIERMVRRKPLQLIPVPDGMKPVDVGISWLAFSEAVVFVPAETTGDDELRIAVAEAIKRDGLPELVDNPSLSFVSAMDAYAPKGPEGFVMGPDTAVEIE